MLILSRKTGEIINIGDNVRITVVAIIGGRVKLGFDAPKSVKVVRDEIDDSAFARDSRSGFNGTAGNAVGTKHKEHGPTRPNGGGRMPRAA